jgi:hypothetical protein
MTIEYQYVESLLERIKLLPPEYRVQLMHGILETLISAPPSEDRIILRFGEFKDFDGPLSTYEDYALAEWWPSEHDLNGE